MSELDMTDAVAGLEETTRLRIIKKAVSNFGVAQTEQAPGVPLWVEGILQAIDPQRLLVKPEGERSWNWSTFWCSERLELDWVLEDSSETKMRIMSRSDWSQGGYFLYDLTEGPTP